MEVITITIHNWTNISLIVNNISIQQNMYKTIVPVNRNRYRNMSINLKCAKWAIEIIKV